jgi:hypothetical protein
MAIDRKTAQILYRRAAESYAQKLKAEVKNIKPIKTIFNGILSDFEKTYKKYGHVISLDGHRNKLENHLKSIHENTAYNFSDKIREVLGKPSNEAYVNRKLEAHIKGFAAHRSNLMSHKIIDTTRDNLASSIKYAHEYAVKEGMDITHKVIAQIATDHLKNKFIGRSNTIAITETQSGAEKGKSLEYKTLSESNSEFDGRNINEMKAQKMWATILDDHTREWHADADSDTVDIDEPYEVNGEELMEPGDDSLGASEDNIINCRCSSEPFFE